MKQTNQQKSEIEWEKEFDEIMKYLNWETCICCGRYRNKLKPKFFQFLAQSRQQLAEEIIQMIDKEMVWAGKSLASTGEIGYLNGILDGLKKKIQTNLTKE